MTDPISLNEPVSASRYNLAKLVLSRMKTLKWSPEALAAEAGIGRGAVDKLCEGLGYFYLPDLMKLLRILGVTIGHEPTWPADRYEMRKTHRIFKADDGRLIVLPKGVLLGKAPKKRNTVQLY